MARYILGNKASATLDGAVGSADTSIQLKELSSTMTTALGAVDASNRILLTLEGTEYEIVEVTAWDAGTSTATVTREQDGTTAAEWAAGESKAEIRGCKGLLDSLKDMTSSFAGATTDIINLGGEQNDSSGNDILVKGNSWSPSTESISIGVGAHVYQTQCIAIGKNAKAYNPDAVAVGTNAQAYNNNGISFGINSQAHGVGAIAIGDTSRCGAADSIAIGPNTNTGARQICIGSGAVSLMGDSILIGHEVTEDGVDGGSVLIGNNAEGLGNQETVGIGRGVVTFAQFGTAIGSKAKISIHSAGHLAFIPIQPKASAIPTIVSGDMATRHRSAPLTTLASGVIDLKSTESAYHIEIPAGHSPASSRFFIDRIDVIITAASSPGGSPAITVGTTAAGTNILGATVITKDAEGQRQKIDPITDDGVTAIHIKVATAGSGTTYNCRVLVVGYLVENE